MTQSKLQRQLFEKIREGVFGSNFGPNFNILTGGQGAGLGAMLDWFFKQKRGRKKKKGKAQYLVPRVMSVLDLLKLLRSLDNDSAA